MSARLHLHAMLLLLPETPSYELSPAPDGVSAVSCYLHLLDFAMCSTSHAVISCHCPTHALEWIELKHDSKCILMAMIWIGFTWRVFYPHLNKI